MKKITLSIVVLTTLFFSSCEEKTTATPVTSTPKDSTYTIKVNINGVSKVFDNLTVYRDETPSTVSLQIVAHMVGKTKPYFEFYLKEPATGWANNLSIILDGTKLDYVKYTSETGKIYSSLNNSEVIDALNLKFTALNFVKDGLINADMYGKLSYDQDTTKIYLTAGKLKLKAD